MKNNLCRLALSIFTAIACIVFSASQSYAANSETIETVDAYIAERDVSIDVFCRNETRIFEYFNLIVFDDSKLEYAGLVADRGVFWYGYYPTEVVGNRIYVHGWAGDYSGCIDADTSTPGSPLFHIIFNVKPGVSAGMAGVVFSSEGAFDGHWVDCSFAGVTPTPDYYSGGINITGHASHITVMSDSTTPGEQAAAAACLSNGLDLFEYFNMIVFDDTYASVDSIVASRGSLHYGYYPTHISGDTIYVHGWADEEDCVPPDPCYPGDPLYVIHFTIDTSAPIGYSIPLVYIETDPIWNHWIGCDLTTTDSFTGTDGFIYIEEITGEDLTPLPQASRLSQNYPNPFNPSTVIRYEIARTQDVRISVYDANGNLVRTLYQGRREPGRYETAWDGRNAAGSAAASGIYFYRIESPDLVQAKKMILIR